MLNRLSKLAAILLTAIPCYAGDVLINQFGGLNSQDNPATLKPFEASDLLNVDITPGGTSIKKREGLSLYKTLTFSTSPVHGIYYFQDSSGNGVQLYGNDRFFYASVNSGAIVQIATGTYNATWQCTDSVGFAYCFTSSRDSPVRTAGTAATTTYQLPIATGTMATSTPDRLVVAGISGNASTLYFSAANTFTDHNTGLLDASAFQEVINSQGSRITHVRYACGKVLWWKDQSFGYSVGTSQYDMSNVVISPNIGSLDNSSTEYNGHVYFRGQDNHIYDYDCSNVTRLSRAITPTISSSGRRVANSWTQTSQSDFTAGVSSPSVPLSAISFTITSGDVTPDSFTVTEAGSASGWGSGTASNLAVGTSSLTLTMADTNIANNSFETGAITNWTLAGGASQDVATTGVNCTLTPRTGTKMLGLDTASIAAGFTVTASLRDCISGSDYTSTTINEADNSCTWTARTLSSSSARGHRIKVHFANNGNLETADSDCFVNSGTDMTFYTASDVTRLSVPTLRSFVIDDVTSGSDTVTTGSLISQVYNLGMSYGTISASVTWSANTSTPTFVLEKSANGSTGWTTLTIATGVSVGTDRQYIRYATTITVNSGDNALAAITGVNIIARSSGTYMSAVNNAPNLSSWGSLTQTDTTVGNSTVTYYVRASTGSFTVQSSTPVWTLQTKNSTPNYSTGTYMQLRADFTVPVASDIPSIQDFTFNWNEGVAADKAYIKYFNDNVWVSVSSGTNGINNQIQRWDLLDDAWLLDNIGSNGFLVDTNVLYIGSASAGKIYKFGGVSTDEGASINGFWKSKAFIGQDPFVKNEYLGADFIVKQTSSTLTATYTVDSSTPTSYTVNTYDPVRSILQRSTNFPSGKIGGFIDMKFSNNSGDTKFEVLGIRIRYNPLPWKIN